jgi:hypothetical protein
MALSILDGNQSATTLSTILSSGQHITAHTVVSLGTQAITDMRSAVSGSVVSISNFPSSQVISGTVTANLNTPNFVGTEGDAPPLKSVALGFYSQIEGEFRNVGDVGNKFPVNAGVISGLADGDGTTFGVDRNFPVDIISALPAGTNHIGVVTIGGGTVTIGAGTAQIGSVTASISGTVPISISSVTVGNSVTIGSLPAISGTVTANTFALQGTAVTTSNFTSTTASTVLANFNATREVLTIFSEGPGQLFIAPGATCTTIAYQVRLSAGDYYEVPNHQTTITHSAVFATAGTARVTELS